MRRVAAPRQPRGMRKDPVLILSALLAALGPLVGNGLYAGPAGDEQEVLAALREGVPAAGYAGYGLELVGFVAMVVLFGWLAAFLFRPAPVAAACVAVGGAAMVAVKLGSAAFAMAAVALADDIDATTARLLLDLGDEAFVLEGFLLGVALAAAGLGLLATSAPRWLAWWPAVVGVLASVTAGIGVVAPSAYVPIPFLLLLVWMIALGIRSALGSPFSESPTGTPVAQTMTA